MSRTPCSSVAGQMVARAVEALMRFWKVLIAAAPLMEWLAISTIEVVGPARAGRWVVSISAFPLLLQSHRTAFPL